TIDVDDLLVHQVLPQADLVGPLAELVDVDRGRRQARAGEVERGHGRPGHEDLASVGRDDEAGDGRIAITDRDDQVGDLADWLALPVEHRPADGLGQVQHWANSRTVSSAAGGAPSV